VHAEIGFKAGAWDLSFSGNVNGLQLEQLRYFGAVGRGRSRCNNGSAA